jgi:hypothetical protein
MELGIACSNASTASFQAKFAISLARIIWTARVELSLECRVALLTSLFGTAILMDRSPQVISQILTLLVMDLHPELFAPHPTLHYLLI